MLAGVAACFGCSAKNGLVQGGLQRRLLNGASGNQDPVQGGLATTRDADFNRLGTLAVSPEYERTLGGHVTTFRRIRFFAAKACGPLDGLAGTGDGPPDEFRTLFATQIPSLFGTGQGEVRRSVFRVRDQGLNDSGFVRCQVGPQPDELDRGGRGPR